MTQHMGNAVILTNGKLDSEYAKTAHGLIRGTERFDVIAVIDPVHAGQDAGQVLDNIHRDIPIYPDLESCISARGCKPDVAVIGVAVIGGRLDEEWQQLALSIVNQGISLVNGMHMFLGEIPAFQEAAKKSGARIIDIRRPKSLAQLSYWCGDIFEVTIPSIAVLGTDCAVGKRTTARFIRDACTEKQIRTEMIYTGQTGWLQGNRYGFILDSTLNDFVSGEIEAAMVQCAREAKPDLMVVEGQSALRNPMGPCGSEIIVSGNIKGVILQHAPFRTHVDGMEKTGCLVPDLETELKLVELYGSRVIAISLNGHGGTTDELLEYAKALEARINTPVTCPLEQGMDRMTEVIQSYLEAHPGLPDTSARG